jgi:hypothetical protein
LTIDWLSSSSGEANAVERGKSRPGGTAAGRVGPRADFFKDRAIDATQKKPLSQSITQPQGYNFTYCVMKCNSITVS